MNRSDRNLVGWVVLMTVLSVSGAAAQDPEAEPAAAPTAAVVAEPDTPSPTEPAAAPAAAPAPLASVPAAASPLLPTAPEASGWLLRESLRPMWERLAGAVPGLLTAIGLLALFWILGALLGGGIKRLLAATGIGKRIAAWLGLEMADPESERLNTAIGAGVKWLILLFGFVAFFQALDLAMVAGPLQGILDRILAAVPNLLNAGLILLVYWAVASLLRLAVSRGLAAIGFDAKAEKYIPVREIKGEKVGPAAMVGRLLFYLILLFGIPPFLDALGQEALVVPLRDMLAKVLAFIPNIVAALILLFIGKLIATIVREVVTNFLAAAGADAAAERLGLGQAIGSRKVSHMIGAVAYFFIFVPVLVAAVDSLQIKAISDPVKNTLEQLLAAIPLLFVALVVVLIGYTIARFVRGLVTSFLDTVGFDALPGKLGLSFLRPKSGQKSLSEIAGVIVMVIILLLTIEQALASLELVELASIFGTLIAFLPKLVVGLLVILAALSLGGFAGKLVAASLGEDGQGRLVSMVAQYAIVFLGFSMGLDQLGVAEDILRVAVSAVLGAIALALGLAFGLGGREKAKELLEEKGLESSRPSSPPQGK